MLILLPKQRELTKRDCLRMCIGRRYWGATMDQIPDSAAYKAPLQRYLEKLPQALKDGMGLLLQGPYRSGKTSAAAIVAKASVAWGATVLFLPAEEIVRAIIEKKSFDGEQSLEQRIREVNMLVIDDVGREYSKEYGTSTIEWLLRMFYDSKRCVVMTTNKSLGELTKKYGDSFKEIAKALMTRVVVDGVAWSADEHENSEGYLGEDK